MGDAGQNEALDHFNDASVLDRQPAGLEQKDLNNLEAPHVPELGVILVVLGVGGASAGDTTQTNLVLAHDTPSAGQSCRFPSRPGSP